MKIIHREDVKPFKKDAGSSSVGAYEYETGNEHINVAEVIILGRYPDEKRWAVNRVSMMVVYVLSGEGRIAVRDKKGHATRTLFKVGSVIEINPNEEYAWEPDEAVRLLPASYPAWTPDQHQTIE